MNKVKPIAIVLPQFHPIPENNAWWGEGFTEWTNVVKGRPRFKGHYQPHLPKNLGYYDLRLAETREAQAELAKKYGIYGFCYYHYWFNGRCVLEKPVDAILESSQPDFPFMLCWANENWSRNWDGGFKDILIEQNHSVEDFINHAQHLVKYFKDKRYIKIEGKPVFVIYKDLLIENVDECIRAFRAELKRNDIDVFLCRFERGSDTSTDFTRAFSIFDAGIEFQPLTRQFSAMKKEANSGFKKYLRVESYIRFLRKKLSLKVSDDIFQYKDIINNDLNYNFQKGLPIFPGVCPSWDNSARRVNSHALIINNSTPDLFEEWVEGKVRKTNWDLVPESFVFVNAWNEWAEGNHLEPCERWGEQYLSALQRGVKKALVN